MNDRGGTVSRWMVMLMVAVLLIFVFCVGVTLHLLQQGGFTLDLPNPHG